METNSSELVYKLEKNSVRFILIRLIYVQKKIAAHLRRDFCGLVENRRVELLTF